MILYYTYIIIYYILIYIYSIWFLSYYQLCVSYVVHVCIIWFLYRTYTVYLRWSPEAGSDSLHHRCGAPWGEGASDSMGIYIYILYIYAIYTIRYILLDIYYVHKYNKLTFQVHQLNQMLFSACFKQPFFSQNLVCGPGRGFMLFSRSLQRNRSALELLHRNSCMHKPKMIGYAWRGCYEVVLMW